MSMPLIDLWSSVEPLVVHTAVYLQYAYLTTSTAHRAASVHFWGSVRRPSSPALLRCYFMYKTPRSRIQYYPTATPALRAVLLKQRA